MKLLKLLTKPTSVQLLGCLVLSVGLFLLVPWTVALVCVGGLALLWGIAAEIGGN